MFEHFVGAKVEKRRQRTRTIAIVSIVVHAGFLLGLLAHGFWQIERLGMPKREISLAVAPRLEVPEPPAPSVKRPTPPEPRQKRVRPKDPIQPVDRLVDEPPVEIDPEAEPDSLIGVDGGKPGDGQGIPGIGASRPLFERIEAAAPPSAPPAPKPPEVVPPTEVEAQRVLGEKFIQPEDGTKLQMAREGRERVEARVTMCLSTRGDVTRTRLDHSSGYPEYDARILEAMQAWKYRPYLRDGAATPVCTQVRFIYSQR